MPYPLHAPRVNNNDDIVQLVELNVAEGDFVKAGQVVGAVETDKALVDVEAEREGYVLKMLSGQSEKVEVGSILMWIGDSLGDSIPEEASPPAEQATASSAGRPTAKASAMLKELGLKARGIPANGERLTVADIEAYLANNPDGASMAIRPAAARERPLDVPGEFQDLSAEAHGMLSTVLWHRDQAAHGYLEIEYDPAPWDSYASDFAQRHKLMLSPLLPLLAYRLVELAKDRTKINATILDNRRYVYEPVNLGFTVQAGETLFLGVVRDAHIMDPATFIAALGEVQRHAMAHKLKSQEASGATIGFSSMARWNISRHIPILPPQTALMIAHAVPRDSGKAVLGASYDHRLLSGFDVAQVLQGLSQPLGNG